eukprot:2016664-Prymnesium_polylepis.1
MVGRRWNSKSNRGGVELPTNGWSSLNIWMHRKHVKHTVHIWAWDLVPADAASARCLDSGAPRRRDRPLDQPRHAVRHPLH